MPLLQACLSFCLQIRFMPNYFAIKFKQHTLKKKELNMMTVVDCVALLKKLYRMCLLCVKII